MKELLEFYSVRLKLILKNIFYSFYPVKNNEMKDIISINREFLNVTGEFINKEIYANNNYGIPPYIYKNINKIINNSITYSDLINFLINKIYSKKVNYLETGVSVMKNFLQINNFVNNSSLYAYEIEEINELFKMKFSENTDTFDISKGDNSLFYFVGDLGSEEENKRFNEGLNNIKFDFVFSDAHHQPWALVWEYKNVIKKNLGNEFIIYFDDFDFPGMEKVVLDIKNDLNSFGKEIFGVSFYVNGWVGQYEKLHKNAIISTFDIKQIFDVENIKLPFLKKL